jgi:hypothetical protein
MKSTRHMTAQGADAAADVSAWKRETDERVYRLYGLTPDGTKLMGERVGTNSRPHRFSPSGAPSL